MNTHLVQADGSGAMFDGIARRYDLLNRLMSFGLDRGWRRKLIDSMPGSGCLLDVATGTADVALSLAKTYPDSHVTGLDPSSGMLAVGQGKLVARQLEERIELVAGDAQDMPFPDNHFHGTTIAFGIRNVPNRLAGLQEMARVTRSGGPVAILELSEPDGGLMSILARLHVHYMVPFMGRLLSGQSEYRYLRSSIASFPPTATFVALMTEAGLENIEVTRLTFGTAHLYIGRAP